MKSKVASILQLARQIAEKDGRTFQHAKQNHGLTSVVTVDVSAHLSHALGDLLTRKENLQLGHGDSY